jgi:hypothetical protein
MTSSCYSPQQKIKTERSHNNSTNIIIFIIIVIIITVIIVIITVTTTMSPYNMPWRHRGGVDVTSALDGDMWSAPRPGCFNPEKETRYPFNRRLSVPEERPQLVCRSLVRPVN